MAIEIAKKMPTRNAGTRYALFNFASGVDFLFDHGPQILSAREASLYLNSLDQAIGRAMGRQAVDRSIVLKWSKVSFGPAISPSGGADIVPFNPALPLAGLSCISVHGTVLQILAQRCELLLAGSFLEKRFQGWSLSMAEGLWSARCLSVGLSRVEAIDFSDSRWLVINRGRCEFVIRVGTSIENV